MRLASMMIISKKTKLGILINKLSKNKILKRGAHNLGKVIKNKLIKL
jgi:hypothetical protein